MNRKLAIALIALSLPLAGCGNKGSLVLPTKSTAEAAPIEPAANDAATPEATAPEAATPTATEPTPAPPAEPATPPADPVTPPPPPTDGNG